MAIVPEKFVQGKTGLSVPVSPNSKKGLTIQYGDDQLMKLMIMMISDNSSENPFEDLNIFLDVPFTLQDGNAEGFIRTKMQNVSDILEQMQRAKFLMDTMTFNKNHESGDFDVYVTYQNLKTFNEGDLNTSFGGS